MEEPKKAETHKWKWHVPNGATKLIIGTFPTQEKNWSFDFFYPNCANNFWRVLSTINNTQLKYISGIEAITERKKILEDLGVGVTDMGYKINRKEKNSFDHKLELIEFMDIIQILRENNSLNKIILTSSSGKVSAYHWVCQYLKQNDIAYTFQKSNLPFYGKIHFEREIDVAVVSSTSPLAAIEIDILISQYRKEIDL